MSRKAPHRAPPLSFLLSSFTTEASFGISRYSSRSGAESGACLQNLHWAHRFWGMASVALMAFRASLRESGKMQRAFHKSFAPAGGHGHSEVRLPRCRACSLPQQHIPLCSKTGHNALKRRRECLAVYPSERSSSPLPPSRARNACSDIASSECPCSACS